MGGWVCMLYDSVCVCVCVCVRMCVSVGCVTVYGCGCRCSLAFIINKCPQLHVGTLTCPYFIFPRCIAPINMHLCAKRS